MSSVVTIPLARTWCRQLSGIFVALKLTALTEH
jgi:hypothetical protein